MFRLCQVACGGPGMPRKADLKNKLLLIVENPVQNEKGK